MGTVYIGSPESQPANVVFDTGSEYLAVTSALCDDKTSGNFKFKKYDPNSSSFVERDQKSDRCKTQAYDMHKSDSNKILSKASSKLTYGSAKLQGFIWEDYTCIQPLKAGTQSAVELKLQLKSNKCALFQFLALYKSQGLGKHSDGILGLSPHKDMSKKKLHYLWSLKDNGIIDNAMVSFSVTSKDMGETPYALFGGYNSTQIVGGAAGLKTFKIIQTGSELGLWRVKACTTAPNQCKSQAKTLPTQLSLILEVLNYPFLQMFSTKFKPIGLKHSQISTALAIKLSAMLQRAATLLPPKLSQSVSK